jgi:hypothetical protein
MADTDGAYKYDIALSFAGEQREFVQAVVRELSLPTASVFYDADYSAQLWGEELSEYLVTLYRDEARYVVMFISNDYARKEWCIVERRAALRRRMSTQGPYILPVRLDNTELDEVAGLLGTIGYLDGLRLGAAGVAEAIRQKLGALNTRADLDDDEAEDAPRFAEIQTTQEGLVSLLQERPQCWPWAAFVSVLVQRRKAMETAMRDHKLGFAPRTAERIDDHAALHELLQNTLYDANQIGQQLVGLVEAEAFVSVFGKEFDESTADPDGIVHAATRLMDLYDRYLQLAQRVQGASAHARYTNVLGTLAHIVDEPLAGMEDFINSYVAAVEAMPAQLIAAEGQNLRKPIEMRIHMDEDLLDNLIRQFKDVIDSEEDEDY